ncbi:hypothetical protein GWI33_017298 [Rhynchophorus ferrugineus]|uniref:Uncharacterized protein n=1 Tax=Rhynchophorus ferrugineus TaxID=354439 RepID=A0A834I2A0_RHYFE|nr:hypothetical protein GWI33_017298 [Rhynchophorus ferrugineus]
MGELDGRPSITDIVAQRLQFLNQYVDVVNEGLITEKDKHTDSIFVRASFTARDRSFRNKSATNFNGYFDPPTGPFNWPYRRNFDEINFGIPFLSLPETNRLLGISHCRGIS